MPVYCALEVANVINNRLFCPMNIRLLKGLSASYLLLPNLLFFLYWTRPAIALVGIGLLIYAYAKHCLTDAWGSPEPLVIKDLIWILSFAIFLVLISGVGGLFYQTLDHWGHNSKLYELFRQPWPLVYPSGGAAYSYYFGYYLVPALVSKMIGFFSEGVLFLWTLIGFALGVAWIYLILNKKILYVILSLSFGATPKVIAFIFRQLGQNPYANYGDVLILTLPVLDQSLWVPNQVIPTIIIAGMLVHLVKTGGDLQEMVLPVALSLWWAVFPALLSGLLIGIMIVRQWCLDGFYWPKVLTKVLIPVLSCIPILLLFASHKSVPISGFLWEFDKPIEFISRYAFEMLLNIILFYLAFRIFYEKRPEKNTLHTLFYLTIGLMLLMPFYRIGVYNDFLLKGIQSSLLITSLLVLIPVAAKSSYQSLVEIARKSVLNFAVIGLLLLSLVSSTVLIVESVKSSAISNLLFPNQKLFTPIPYDQYPTIYDMLVEKFSTNDGEQYLGQEGSFYELYVR